MKINQQYVAALKDMPMVPTTSCRLVLCGDSFAGKTTLLQTMTRITGHHHDSGHRRALSTAATHGTIHSSSSWTRGIDIQSFTAAEGVMTMSVWDVGGRREFHPLVDSIFPGASCLHAANVFVFTFNPLQQHPHQQVWSKEEEEDDSRTTTLDNKCNLQLKTRQQFEQEFSYWFPLHFTFITTVAQTSRANCGHAQGYARNNNRSCYG